MELSQINQNTLKILLDGVNVAATRFDNSFPQDGWMLVEEYPLDILVDPFNWMYVNGKFVKESQEEIAERENKERFYEYINDTSDNRKIDLLLSALVKSTPTLPKPQNRPGYLWKMMYDESDGVFGWEEVSDPYYKPQNSGTYTDPIQYHVGDNVSMYTNPDPFTGDGWYSYDGDVKVCIKNGVPGSFDDEQYFAYSIDD